MVMKDCEDCASLGEESQNTKDRSKRTHTVKLPAHSAVSRGLDRRGGIGSRATVTAGRRCRIRRRPVRT